MKKMQRTSCLRIGWMGVSTALHFLVDGLCVCCLYLMSPWLDASWLFTIFLTYNVLAFMTQPLTGACADRALRPHQLLTGAVCLLALAALGVFSFSLAEDFRGPVGCMIVALLLGMGNSLFHVWGGKQTVMLMGNDMRALGCFVSSGALGLAVGFVFSSWWLLAVLLSAMTFLAGVSVRLSGDVLPNGPSHETITRACPPDGAERHPGPVVVWTAVILVAAFVMFRSYIGEVFSSSATKTQTLVLLMGLVSMAGKMAGGWIAFRFGAARSMAVMLLGFVGCFLFRQTHAVVLLSGLFLVNCTMPVTLYWANGLLKGREGLAFGILAAVLVPGYLLAVFG